MMHEGVNDKTGHPDVNFNDRHEGDVLNVYLTTSRNGIDWDLSWLYKGRLCTQILDESLVSSLLCSGEPFVERGRSGVTAWFKVDHVSLQALFVRPL